MAFGSATSPIEAHRGMLCVCMRIDVYFPSASMNGSRVTSFKLRVAIRKCRMWRILQANHWSEPIWCNQYWKFLVMPLLLLLSLFSIFVKCSSKCIPVPKIVWDVCKGGMLLYMCISYELGHNVTTASTEVRISHRQ